MTIIRDLRIPLRLEATRRSLNPRDIDVLIADAIGRDASFVFAHDDHLLTDVETGIIQSNAQRRFSREPLQYIRGRAEFYGHDFFVGPGVLIPRPETEILVEAALSRARADDLILDVGTGSGCIAASLALATPSLRVMASDRSLDALAIARRNASALNASVRFVAGSDLRFLQPGVSAIVSNPPYIDAAEVESLQDEVRDHEPRGALTPGADGLSMVRELLEDGRRVLQPGGWMMIEIGYDQAGRATTLADALGWTVDAVHRDLAGIPRILEVTRA